MKELTYSATIAVVGPRRLTPLMRARNQGRLSALARFA
jgi:hypothetical protein